MIMRGCNLGPEFKGKNGRILWGLNMSEIGKVNLDLILFEVLFSEILPDQEVFEYLEVALLSFLLLSKISIFQFSHLAVTDDDFSKPEKTRLAFEFEILALLTSDVKTSISSFDSFCLEVTSL